MNSTFQIRDLLISVLPKASDGPGIIAAMTAADDTGCTMGCSEGTGCVPGSNTNPEPSYVIDPAELIALRAGLKEITARLNRTNGLKHTAPITKDNKEMLQSKLQNALKGLKEIKSNL